MATLVPDDEIVLRYRDAIREKYDNKYHNYIQNGLIMPTDGYVIAIKHPHNPLATGNRLRHGFLEVGREHISTEYNDGCAIKVTNWN
ncbi:MAG TPA: hypothetical protein G4N93_00635 [Dehalococcoidia bacterium]|nr:hypothetical protein [Dehalococcoidia bacterium]